MELLAYTSEAAAEVDGSDVFGIVATSARNNVSSALTGILFFKDKQFFQIVEGPSEALDNLLARLAKDKRHSDMQIIERVPTEVRYFPEWNMKRVFNVNANAESERVRARLASLPGGAKLERELSQFFDSASSKAA